MYVYIYLEREEMYWIKRIETFHVWSAQIGAIVCAFNDEYSFGVWRIVEEKKRKKNYNE